MGVIWGTVLTLATAVLTLVCAVYGSKLRERYEPHADDDIDRLLESKIGRWRFLRRFKRAGSDTPRASTAPTVEEETPKPPPASAPRKRERRVHEPPLYTEDVFFGVRWRWRWFYSTPYQWYPDDLAPFCVNRHCDLRMTAGRAPTLHGDAVLFECEQPPGCGSKVRMEGAGQEIQERIVRLIERNQRNGVRGESGVAPSEPPTS